jgi:hypothetical protein
MNIPENSPDHSGFPVLSSNSVGSGEAAKLLIRWGAALFCALFWLGLLALIAYADQL